jgi:mannose-1-phosphate guanylyltransferase/mannose-1-phosphate guanylyltransferase/phosphomannomutase
MILAGGLSTRLYPLTKSVPKPLVPVAGVPNAVHLMRYLKNYGFDEVVINLHYLADAIVATLGDGSEYGVRLEYSYEPELLGSAGGLKKVQAFFDDEPFLVIGCDEVTNIALDDVLAFHRDRNAIATIGLVECDPVDQYGVVVLGERAKIVGFQEKPPKGTERSKLANTGVYFFSPEIFERIPSNEFYDFGKQVFPALQSAGEAFYGFDAKGAYWSDIGTPLEYRRASYDVVRGVVRIPQTRADGIDPSAKLGSGVRIEGPVRIGASVQIEDGVTIAGPCILDDGVFVGSGAHLERSVVWENSTIGSGANLRGTVVGRDYAVAAGVTLENTLVANNGDANV